MARVFRDDDQNQSFPSAPRCAALLALILSMVLPMFAAASGIPPTDPGNRDLGAVVELVTAGQFTAADGRIDAALNGSGLSPDTRRAF